MQLKSADVSACHDVLPYTGILVAGTNVTPSTLAQGLADTSTVNHEQLHDDLILAHGAVSLVQRLLDLHPLSQRTPAAVLPMLASALSHSGDQTMKDGSIQEQTAAAVLSQVQAAFPQTPRQRQTNGRKYSWCLEELVLL